MSERWPFEIEPGRGVYDTKRAAALSGVPVSTLRYWARKGIYLPSIEPDPYTRLWSWADLLALRAIDWLRRAGGTEERKRASMYKIRAAIKEMANLAIPREELYRVVASTSGGELFLLLDTGLSVRASPGNQATLPDLLLFARPYHGAAGNAPDLLSPKPLLRIIPGKLHGEPHVLNTRIPSAAIYALSQSGFSLAKIRRAYPAASEEAIVQAIDLERSLSRAA